MHETQHVDVDVVLPISRRGKSTLAHFGSTGGKYESE